MATNSSVTTNLDYLKRSLTGKKRVVWKKVVNYILILFLFTFLYWSFIYLRIPIRRFFTMWGPVAYKINQLFMPPDFSYINNMKLLRSIVQTFQLAFLGTVIGLVLCVPLAWFAAINVTPSKFILYPLSKGIIILSRSIYEIIWAILFTMILGFGPLAGTLTCILATVGFSGKLMAEEVEAIKVGPIEAIKATGGNEFDVLFYAIFPQVRVAWTGISIYSWDSTFRLATILGYVGVGGIGMYLRETIETLDYPKTGMTLIIIISLVIVSEVTSASARKKVM